MANPVVHFEIMGPPEQKERLRAFYQDAFDWLIEPMGPMEYGMVAKPEGEPGIAGAVESWESGPAVVVYLQVDGIRDYVERAKQHGAEVVTDVTDIPGMVTMAQIKDPAGNIIGLVDSKTPDAAPD